MGPGDPYYFPDITPSSCANKSSDGLILRNRATIPFLRIMPRQDSRPHQYNPRPSAFDVGSYSILPWGVRTMRTNSLLGSFTRQAAQFLTDM